MVPQLVDRRPTYDRGAVLQMGVSYALFAETPYLPAQPGLRPPVRGVDDTSLGSDQARKNKGTTE